jgi:hypothetical protein
MPVSTTIRIYNDTAVEIRVKAVGVYGGPGSQDQAFMVRDIPIGGNTLVSGFYVGWRAFVAFDDLTGEIKGVHRENITGPTRVRLAANYSWVVQSVPDASNL